MKLVVCMKSLVIDNGGRCLNFTRVYVKRPEHAKHRRGQELPQAIHVVFRQERMCLLHIDVAVLLLTTLDTNADAFVVRVVGCAPDAFVRPQLAQGLLQVLLLESVFKNYAPTTRGVLQVVPELFQEPVHGVKGIAQGHAHMLDVVLRQDLPPANHDRDDTRQRLAICAVDIALSVPLDPQACDGLLDLNDQGRIPGTISTNDIPDRCQ